MESTATIKKVRELVLEVDEDDQETTEHELTLTLHGLDRKQFLQLVRQAKRGHSVSVILGFLQPELNMGHVDAQVRDAMNIDQTLHTSSGYTVGDSVCIKETGEVGTLKRIIMGATEPMFWIFTEDQPTKEYTAGELERVPTGESDQ